VGVGDEIMAAGHAEWRYRQRPSAGRVAICDARGHARSHLIWQGNPVIAPPLGGYVQKRHPDTPFIQNAKGCRPYIQYPFTDQTGWRWATDWSAREHGRGTIYLTQDEIDKGAVWAARYGQFLLIEPSPVRGCKNRRYPHESWTEIALGLQEAGIHVLQPEHPASRLLDSTLKAPHQGFREACGILQHAALFLGTEGGLAHAAAALRTPAVVLWGGCISAPVLGYPEHVNLVDDAPETPCGQMKPCDHCKAAWARLTPQQVIDATLAEWLRVTSAKGA
jgi:hypothetical protein